jgi:hypothetical protein
MTNSTNNEWEKAFGARRRAIDRALLAEAEAAINLTPEPEGSRLTSEATQAPKTPEQASWLASEARNRIAKAFGRALS